MSEEEFALSPSSPTDQDPQANQSPQVVFYESANFRLRVTPKAPQSVLFEVECSPRHAEKLLNDAVETVRHHVAVPGFRKGKAPKEHILKSCYPAVEKTWKQMLREEGLSFAIFQSGYTPLIESQLLQVDVELGKAGSPPFMRCLCDAMSPIPHIDLEVVRAQLKAIAPTTVKQEEKDQALMELVRFHSTWNTVDRPAREGDRLHIAALEANQQKILEKLHWTTIDLDASIQQIPWARALIGSQPNEIKNCFILGENEELFDSSLYPAGARSIPMRIVKIEEPTLHPTDDTLAKKAGCHNIAQLLGRIEASLKQRAARTTKMERLLDLKTVLLKSYPISIHPALLRLQIEMRRPILDAVELPQGKYEELHGLELFRAYEFLSSAYLLRTWLLDNNIQLTDRDLEEEYIAQQKLLDPSSLMIHSEMEPIVLRQQLTWLATIHKGMMHLLKKFYPETTNS